VIRKIIILFLKNIKKLKFIPRYLDLFGYIRIAPVSIYQKKNDKS